MKKVCLLTCLVFTICLPTQSQTSQLEYRSFAQDGKIWEAQVGLIMENLYGNFIDGDTIINNVTWKKVYNYVGWPETGYTYYAAIRDEEKKVYAIAKGSQRPRLLYDFNLQKGEILKCGVEGNAFGCLLDKDEKLDTLLGFPFKSFLKVENIDTIMVRNMKHRRITLSLRDAYKQHYLAGEYVLIEDVVWIEGVGSGAGPFSPWMPLPPRDSYMQNCMIDNTILFAYPDFYEAETTTPINHTRYNKSEEGDSQGSDLQGRRIQDNPKHGVYIRNGKKVVK